MRYRGRIMKNVFLLMIRFVSTVACLLRFGGTKAVLAESLLLKHQLLIPNRPRKGAPNLGPLDRVLLGVAGELLI